VYTLIISESTHFDLRFQDLNKSEAAGNGMQKSGGGETESQLSLGIANITIGAIFY
jgi:hypothetical protein